MSAIWRDYGERHSGVLGEADDLYFVRSGPESTPECLICWKPYFDAIMSGLEPGSNGWSGLALEYHVDERWNDGDWELPDVPAAVEQLRAVDRGTSSRWPWGATALVVLDDLVAFLERAASANQTVTISSR